MSSTRRWFADPRVLVDVAVAVAVAVLSVVDLASASSVVQPGVPVIRVFRVTRVSDAGTYRRETLG